jgi:hypothetical protein
MRPAPGRHGERETASVCDKRTARTYRLTGHSIDRRGNALLLHKYVQEEWDSTLGPRGQRQGLCGI